MNATFKKILLLLRLSIVGLASANDVECRPGHWPLRSYCHVKSSELWFDTHIEKFSSRLEYPSSLNENWNIVLNSSRPLCSHTIESVIFVPIAYDRMYYESDGSNYYIIHVDNVIPLWNLIENIIKNRTNISIVLYAFNYHRKYNLFSDAFNNNNKYWIKSITLLYPQIQFVSGTIEGFENYIISNSKQLSHINQEQSVLCFDEVFFGLPLYDNPSYNAISKYSQQYRKVIIIISLKSFIHRLTSIIFYIIGCFRCLFICYTSISR
jgi:hypothetical protein